MTVQPIFVGDGPDTPVTPDGAGGVLLTFHFTSRVDRYRGGMLLDDRPNWDIWVPPPVLALDGEPARASWSTWFYPLAPGTHRIEVREPATRRHQLQVTAGEVVRLRYQASITIRKDHTDTHILQWHQTAKLRSAT